MISRRKFVTAAAQSLALASAGHALQGVARQRVRGLREAVAWTPASLASIVDWAIDTDLTTDAEGIITITGREGDIILKQTAPSQKAAYDSTGSPNNNGIADPDGGDEISTAISGGQFTSSPLAQPFCFACLVRFDALSSSNNMVFSGANAGTRFLSLTSAGVWSLNFGAALNTGAIGAIDTWYRVIAFVNGASSWLRVNGSEVKAGNAGSNNLNGIKFFEDFSGSNHLDGKFMPWMLGSAEPSAGDITNIDNWLAAY